ncbi:MAG: hypothetical protein ACFFCQ_09725 [Promethearchaeota archaeon]
MLNANRTIKEILETIRQAEKAGDYNLLNQRLLKKRLSWYKENKEQLILEGSDVKKAYTLLLFEYLKIHPEEVPIVYEDEKKIVWRSYNWCPVLEACKMGGFDTREICKKGWEQSVQELIKNINQNLRFTRNYKKIRPHAEYCEEIIKLVE